MKKIISRHLYRGRRRRLMVTAEVTISDILSEARRRINSYLNDRLFSTVYEGSLRTRIEDLVVEMADIQKVLDAAPAFPLVSVCKVRDSDRCTQARADDQASWVPLDYEATIFDGSPLIGFDKARHMPKFGPELTDWLSGRLYSYSTTGPFESLPGRVTISLTQHDAALFKMLYCDQ